MLPFAAVGFHTVPPPPACAYGKERLHADAGLPGSAFMKPEQAVRLVAGRQRWHDFEVVWVRRVRWGKFAFARCSGVADDRMVYVVRLRFPRGFVFSHGMYDPGTLVDAALDARTGERFNGHVIGRVSCFTGGPQRPPDSPRATWSPACAARWRALTR